MADSTDKNRISAAKDAQMQDRLKEVQVGLENLINPVSAANAGSMAISTTAVSVLSLSQRHAHSHLSWGWVHMLLSPMPGTTALVEVKILFNGTSVCPAARQSVSISKQSVFVPVCYQQNKGAGTLSVTVKTDSGLCMLEAGEAQLLLCGRSR